MRVRSTELVLAAAGALVAHEFGYGTAALLRLGATDPGHGHMSLLLGAIIPLAAFIAGLGVLRLLRHQVAQVDPRRLVAIQVVLFLWLELAEHAAAGNVLATFTNPAVLLGLLAQPVVARAIDRVLRRAAAVLGSHHDDPLVFSGGPDRLAVAAATGGFPVTGGFLLPLRRGPPD